MLSKKKVVITISILLLLFTVVSLVNSQWFSFLQFAPSLPQDLLPQSITVYAYGPNGLLSKQSGGETRYYHTDSLGSSTLVTDTEGKVVYRSDYEPFGDSLHTSGEERYTYTGKELDDSTGLYYSGARYYDSSIGRFISSDPLSGNLYNSQRLNRYTYVLNNPMVYTDPSGAEPHRALRNINYNANENIAYISIPPLNNRKEANGYSIAGQEFGPERINNLLYLVGCSAESTQLCFSNPILAKSDSSKTKTTVPYLRFVESEVQREIRSSFGEYYFAFSMLWENMVLTTLGEIPLDRELRHKLLVEVTHTKSRVSELIEENYEGERLFDISISPDAPEYQSNYDLNQRGNALMESLDNMDFIN